MSFKKTALSAIATLSLALATLAFGAAPAAAVPAYSSWDVLKEAVESLPSGGSLTAIISEDLVASSQITIPEGASVTIEGDNVTIWSSPDGADFPMFDVSGAGTSLDLGFGVTLSGKTMEPCGPDVPDPASYTFTAQKLLEGGDITAGMFYVQLYEYDPSTEQETLLQTKTNAADGSVSFDPISFDEEGTFYYTLKEFQGSIPGMSYDENEHTIPINVALNAAGTAYEATPGTPVTPTFSNSYSAPAVESNIGKLTSKSGNKLSFSVVEGSGYYQYYGIYADDSFLELELGPDGELRALYVDPSDRPHSYDIFGSVVATGADTAGLGWGWSWASSSIYVVKPQLNESGGFDIVTKWKDGDEVVLVTSTSDPSTAAVIGLASSSEVDTAHTWAQYSSATNKSNFILTVSDVPNPSGDEGIPGETNPPAVTPTPQDSGTTPSQPSQTCDDPQCGVYTSETFTSGTADDPAAFFVKVSDAGKLEISGAILRDFITDGSVSYAAPIVVKGGSIEISDGQITHNSVGYTAKNNLSGLTANKIGKEIDSPGNYGESGRLGEWANTDGAGAIILTEGASGTISGGSITGNRADTGAILVQGKADKRADTEIGDASTSTLSITGGAIDNNVGIHHAGAIYVFNGGDVRMSGGQINDNFAWNKGGAIWVSEEVYSSTVWNPRPGQASHKRVGQAVFVMQGGTISGNMAVNRGGAIEVMSDHVSLLSGFITDNYCRVLGGAIYVEGDGADRLYQIYIPKACITDNHAVPNRNTATSAPLYRTLHIDPENLCDFSNAMDGPTAGNVSDAGAGGFASYYGHGGGIWMCSYGGNTTLTIAGDEVYVGGNDATIGSPNAYGDLPGQDVLVRPKSRGKTNGVNVLSAGNLNEFKLKDGAGDALETGVHYDGPIALKNTNESGACPADGLHITGNVASNGGGIATNGTVVLGSERAGIYEALTTLKLKKLWSDEIEKKDIVLKIYVEVDGERHPVEGYQVKLNGTADTYVSNVSKDDLGEDEYNENMSAWESEPWMTEFGIPTAVVIDEEVIPLFTFKNPEAPDDPSKNLDPSNMGDLAKIHALIESGDLTVDDAVIGDWNLVIEEIDSETGEVQTQLVTLEGHALETLEAGEEKVTEFHDFAGHVVGTYGTYPLEVGFSGLLGNDIGSQVEKYVNEQVHEDIVYFDQEFTYDIMAYVPLGATEFEISDTLVEVLEFADADGKSSTTPADVIQGIAIKTKNNHKIGSEEGTVAADPESTIDLDELSVDISGQTLSVSANDEDNPEVIESLQGKWIQISFNARIKDDYRDINEIIEMSDEELSWTGYFVDKNSPERPDDETNPNWPVISIEPHEGILNNADYTVKVSNGSEFTHKSNTVTVKPDVDRYQASKDWFDVEGEEMEAWPTDEDGEPVVVTFELWRIDEESGEEEKVAETSITDFETARFTDPENDDREILFPRLIGCHYEIREKVAGVTSALAEDPIVEVSLPKIEGDQASLTYTYIFENKIEKPEIEKFVEKDVHKAIYYNDVFTYDVIAYVPLDADKITITDDLVSDLVFESTEEDIVLVDLGESVDHTPHGESVTAEGTPIEGFTATISGQTLTVVLENVLDPETHRPVVDEPQPVTPLRGRWIKLSFDARLAPDKVERLEAGESAADVLEYATIIDAEPEDRAEPNLGNDPVVSDEDHEGVPNKASYTIEVANEGKYEDESNTVTVKPEEPEIEKYVNQAVHKDIELDEVFTYDVIAYVTRDADKVVITDTLVENLAFATGASQVEVQDLGTDNNHKPAYDVSSVLVNDDATVASSGEAIADAKVSISGQTLTVTIEDATDLRGHWVKVSFEARIVSGKKIADIEGSYSSVSADSVYNDPVSGGERPQPNVGNAPVLSDEDHTGIPNTASYKILVKNEAGIYDERYEDTSNTVTVKPEDDSDEKADNEEPSRKRKAPKTGDPTSFAPIVASLAGSAAALAGAWRLRKEERD